MEQLPTDTPTARVDGVVSADRLPATLPAAELAAPVALGASELDLLPV